MIYDERFKMKTYLKMVYIYQMLHNTSKIFPQEKVFIYHFHKITTHSVIAQKALLKMTHPTLHTPS